VISLVAGCVCLVILAACFTVICYAAIDIARRCDDLEEQLWEERHKDDE